MQDPILHLSEAELFMHRDEAGKYRYHATVHIHPDDLPGLVAHLEEFGLDQYTKERPTQNGGTVRDYNSDERGTVTVFTHKLNGRNVAYSGKVLRACRQ